MFFQATAIFLFVFVVQLVIKGAHEMSEQQYLPYSEILHSSTEAWGPDSTFGHVPLYPVYGTFPRIWGISVMTDQMIAGLTMKIVGGAILWTVITVVFFRWARRDQTEGWDALQWRNVDAEIRAEMGR